MQLISEKCPNSTSCLDNNENVDKKDLNVKLEELCLLCEKHSIKVSGCFSEPETGVKFANEDDVDCMIIVTLL